MDREKLIKVLALTSSDVDGEALAAIRTANKILAAEGTTWGDLLKEPPRTTINISTGRTPAAGTYKSDEDWVPPHLKDQVIINMMFRAVYAQPRGTADDFWKFVDSIHERWRKHGNLSQGQYAALKRSYQRCPPAKAV